MIPRSKVRFPRRIIGRRWQNITRERKPDVQRKNCKSRARWLWRIAGGHLRRYGELIDKGEDRFRIVATVDSDISRAQVFADQINGKAGWGSRVIPRLRIAQFRIQSRWG